jgi:antitoxin Phd
MQVYTYSEARQNLSSVLDEAETSGKVLIRRKDGRTFALAPERPATSPLDVPTIQARITTQELVSMLRKERGRATASTRYLQGRRRHSRKS